MNYEKIELLINIIYDILFYDDIEDLKLKKDIDDKFQEIIENNNLNFSLSKQIKNASQVYLYKDHYKTNILTKFKRYYYKLSDIALVDPLTGFLNRRALKDHILPRIFNNMQRNGINYGLIFIDLDRFKTINDELGHDKGDETLIKFSEIINNVLRNSDYTIRWGGDEFLIIAKIDDIIELSASAERIRGTVESELNHEYFGDLYSVAASIGATLLSDKFKDKKITNKKLLDHFDKVVMKGVDAKVYHSKELGGNQVSIYDGE